MSSISDGMSLSRLLLRTSVSNLDILLMFSGRICSSFLCSHSVCSICILRTDTSHWSTRPHGAELSATVGVEQVFLPVDVVRQLLQAVAPHVKPLQCRKGDYTIWQGDEVVHGQVQVLQPHQVPQLETDRAGSTGPNLDWSGTWSGSWNDTWSSTWSGSSFMSRFMASSSLSRLSQQPSSSGTFRIRL